jgi:hypothetical protein
MSNLFGIFEIFEYEKTCTDPKILAIIKRLRDSRNRNAHWCNHTNELKKEKEKLIDALNKIENIISEKQGNFSTEEILKIIK